MLYREILLVENTHSSPFLMALSFPNVWKPRSTTVVYFVFGKAMIFYSRHMQKLYPTVWLFGLHDGSRLLFGYEANSVTCYLTGLLHFLENVALPYKVHSPANTGVNMQQCAHHWLLSKEKDVLCLIVLYFFDSLFFFKIILFYEGITIPWYLPFAAISMRDFPGTIPANACIPTGLVGLGSDPLSPPPPANRGSGMGDI